MRYTLSPRTLHFRQPAGTSRGIYHTRQVWYVHLSEGTWQGTGECAPLPDLSCDALPPARYEALLHEACQQLCRSGWLDAASLRDYPSILFGLESALGLHLCSKRNTHQGTADTDGTSPASGIPSPCNDMAGKPLCRINGLVWMGSYEEMRARLEEKIEAGFHCIKLKIGAINFADETSLIQRIRHEFSAQEVELRVDANGAFTPGDDVEGKLAELARYELHSIEQPIRQGQWEEMARLCATAPLPIALDEELIGINNPADKVALLDTIRPQYIILKPSLHGGFSGCDEWIRLAEERSIGWWATSALESNVGLTAIAQWVAQYRPTLPQGLGTGLLFTDNTPPHTEVRGDELFLLSSAPGRYFRSKILK